MPQMYCGGPREVLNPRQPELLWGWRGSGHGGHGLVLLEAWGSGSLHCKKATLQTTIYRLKYYAESGAADCLELEGTVGVKEQELLLEDLDSTDCRRDLKLLDLEVL